MRRYKKYSTLLVRLLARLPWAWLMALLEAINLAVDVRLHREGR